MLNPGTEFQKRLSNDADQLLLCFKSDLVLDVASAAFSRRIESFRFSTAGARAGELRALFSLVEGICADIDDGCPTLSASDTSRRLAESIVHILIRRIPHDPVTCASPAVPYYLRRAEQFMVKEVGNHISLSDIATASGVSTRTLSLAFRRYRNTSPMERLREIRLDLTRKALASGDMDTTVAAVAENHGLCHLSRLSMQYRRRFGELPSETLEHARQRKIARENEACLQRATERPVCGTAAGRL